METPKLSDFFNFSEIEKQSDLLKQFLESGGTLQDILRLPNQTLDKIYATGYQLQLRQEYAKAKRFFALLTLFCPGIAKYWWALGASQVALDEHQEALSSYAVLMILEPENPQPHFFSAFCRQQIGDDKEAIQSFEQGLAIQKKRKGT